MHHRRSREQSASPSGQRMKAGDSVVRPGAMHGAFIRRGQQRGLPSALNKVGKGEAFTVAQILHWSLCTKNWKDDILNFQLAYCADSMFDL